MRAIALSPGGEQGSQQPASDRGQHGSWRRKNKPKKKPTFWQEREICLQITSIQGDGRCKCWNPLFFLMLSQVLCQLQSLRVALTCKGQLKIIISKQAKIKVSSEVQKTDKSCSGLLSVQVLCKSPALFCFFQFVRISSLNRNQQHTHPASWL